MLPSGNALGHISDGMVVQEALMKRSNTVFYLLGLAKALFSYVMSETSKKNSYREMVGLEEWFSRKIRRR